MTAPTPRVVLALAFVLAWSFCEPGARAQATADVVQTPAPDPRRVGTGNVRGRVVDGATGQPLRGAMISARWRAAPGRPPRGGDMHFSATTDAQGLVTIESLPDGVYVVSTFRQGYFEPPGVGPITRELTLTGGGTLDLGDIRLMRGGVITGRVLDVHGEPVVGARVAPVGRPPGSDMFTSLGGMTVTDDRGVYRLHGLMPARYTVRAIPSGPSARGPVRLQGDEPEALPAFATAAPDVAAAELVEVRAGEEAVLDVRVPAGRLARVSGRLVFEGEPPTELRPNLSLRSADDGTELNVAWTRAEVDGRFAFPDVAPGRYRVVADEPTVITSDGRARQRAGWVAITVDGDAVDDVVLPVGFGAVVRGRVEVDGGDPAALDGRPLQVVMRMLPGFLGGGSLVATSTADLGFELRDVLGTRRLEVAGLPPGWWLKSVFIDGEEAFEKHTFPVTGVVDGVVLLVSGRESGVAGRVQGTGALLQGASVLVLQDGRAASLIEAQLARRIASVSADGTFTAPALRPGRYMAVALSPSMRSVFDRLDRDARDALLAARGRAVDVVEGRLTSVTLPLVER